MPPKAAKKKKTKEEIEAERRAAEEAARLAEEGALVCNDSPLPLGQTPSRPPAQKPRLLCTRRAPALGGGRAAAIGRAREAAP